MQVTSQQKQEAWRQVAKLCEQAQAVLVDVDEGPVEQAKLDWIEKKAHVQVGLWSTPDWSNGWS